MIRVGRLVGNGGERYRFGSRAGFTLTELVSTTAAATLILTISLSVLTRNREGERTAACLTNLKRLGQAISMYTADFQGTLPGPTTLAIPWNAARVLMPKESEAGGSAWSWYGIQLANYLGPYVDRGDSNPQPADLLPFCPSADGIAVASGSPSPAPYLRPKYYYLANTVGWTAGYARSGNFPYYRTQYGSYFGYVNVPAGDLTRLPPERLPRRLETIPNLASEWAIADIWYWEGSYGPLRGTGTLGTWPYAPTANMSSTITYAGQLLVPSYPFHGTTKSFSPTGTDRFANSPRLTTGKTNTIYLDAHAASVRNWQGTVNPCFGAGPGVCSN